MLSTDQIGTISELQSVIQAIKGKYTVCKPLTTEPFDFLISEDGVTWKKAQTKTIRYREDRESFVCNAKKNNNKRYALDEVDVFLAVHNDEVFLIPHNGNSEHWAKDPRSKWQVL